MFYVGAVLEVQFLRWWRFFTAPFVKFSEFPASMVYVVCRRMYTRVGVSFVDYRFVPNLKCIFLFTDGLRILLLCPRVHDVRMRNFQFIILLWVLIVRIFDDGWLIAKAIAVLWLLHWLLALLLYYIHCMFRNTGTRAYLFEFQLRLNAADSALRTQCVCVSAILDE